MKGDGKFSWWAGRGSQPEIYHVHEDTREEAISAAINDGYDEDDGFTIVEADQSVITASFDEEGLAEQIIETLCENNEECFGEDGPDNPWTTEAEKTLAQAIRTAVEQWLEANPGKTWAFGTMRNEEFFPPKPDEAAAAAPTA